MHEQHHEGTGVVLRLPTLDTKYVFAMVNIGWKIVAVLAVVFRMYFNEQTLLETTKKLETRMSALETEMNKQGREQGAQTAEMIARFNQLISDRSFYEQTANKR
jgi:hypothetical protein